MHTTAALVVVWPFISFLALLLWNLAKIYMRSR